MDIVFFGTQNFCLPILEELNRRHTVKAVVTTPDTKVGRKQTLQESPVALLAKDLNLPIFKPERLKNNDIFRLALQEVRADLFIVVAYGKILPLELVEFPKYKTLNVHPSLLPTYRGPAPIQFALWNGDKETGTSIIAMTAEVDAGPVLAQKSLAIDPDDNYITLSDKLSKLSVQLLEPAIDSYINNSSNAVFQDEDAVTWSRQITKADGKIDWNKSAQEIYNQFRAFFPWPGIWTTWNGQVLKILDCAPVNSSTGNYVPGTVLPGGAVTCGSGNSTLQLNTIQLAGKNETDIRSFLNGYKNFVNSAL